MKPKSRILILLAAIMLLSVIWLPFWKIELSAPQYPEGLVLKIWVDKLAGDVDIINGLNHYIGMRTLHAKDFIEFSVLKYILIALSVLAITVTALNKRTGMRIYFYLYIAFSILCLADFWRWEYNYGHTLDPTAPIQVPGMAYQPPLIGFKQLLNFGAYSIPDLGGWMYLGAGIALALAFFFEWKKVKK